MVAVLLSGSYAVWQLAEANKAVAMFIMLIPTTIGAINMVWGLADRARNHEFLAKRFYEIAKMIDVYKADEKEIHKWRQEILSVYEDEPAIYHALNAECGNAASQALGFGSDDFQPVKWWQHLFRNWYRFSAKDFKRAENSA